jgi:hypothetical protein
MEGCTCLAWQQHSVELSFTPCCLPLKQRAQILLLTRNRTRVTEWCRQFTRVREQTRLEYYYDFRETTTRLDTRQGDAKTWYQSNYNNRHEHGRWLSCRKQSNEKRLPLTTHNKGTEHNQGISTTSKFQSK